MYGLIGDRLECIGLYFYIFLVRYFGIKSLVLLIVEEFYKIKMESLYF